MQRITSGELAEHVDRRVRLAGWLHHRRRLSKLTFVLLRDRAGIAQVVVEDPERIAEVDELLPETVLEVEGTVAAAAEAPGGFEVREPRFLVVARPAGIPPIELRRPELKESLPVQLDHAPVALRHPRRRDVLAIAAAAVGGFRAALDGLGFVEIQAPKLVGAATEGGAEVFAVDYFGREAYLAQSPQLYKQIAVGMFERVYATGPAFRAEPHDTGRHLSEYVSLDAELGFVDDHRDVMAVAREAVAGMVEGVRKRAAGALARLGVELPVVPDPVPDLRFEDALALLGAPPTEPDFTPEHERRLSEWARAEHRSDFLFVVGYPMAKRPFYTHPDPERPGASLGFDLLFRGLEVITGGQRLHRHEDYLAALGARGMSPEPFAGYLEAFRFGMPPHGGFALGLERWTARLVGLANVREATLFPRDRHRLSP
jgi:nondiscriminating aspartyl-tRNA synthetase